eukprot:GFYU01009444.1.p1 GENE.GFYU01009444.1~~GFYU01009444.1.p1  ORF type:complete len:770 (-),score=130.59 GFYU01009444.1:1527-3491(-)
MVYHETGDIYEGEWKEDCKHGFGVYTGQEGNTYKGEWVQGKMEGCGKKVWTNGDVYEGAWRAGRAHGKGRMTYHTGEVFAGEWVEGQRNGYGSKVFRDGSRYDGQWLTNKAHGKGAVTDQVGLRYTATFKHGVRKSDKVQHNTDEYLGEDKDGIPHGQGIMKYWRGDQYQGQWKNGVKCGDGTHVFFTGAVYKGQWKNDKPHGVGRIEGSDGICYEGQFSNGLEEGFGVELTPIGRMYEGDWKAGLYHGKGTLSWANGDLYTGTWSNGYCHGKGNIRLFCHCGGTRSGVIVATELWKNGAHQQEDGTVTYVHTGGMLDPGSLDNSQMEGQDNGRRLSLLIPGNKSIRRRSLTSELSGLRNYGAKNAVDALIDGSGGVSPRDTDRESEHHGSPPVKRISLSPRRSLAPDELIKEQMSLGEDSVSSRGHRKSISQRLGSVFGRNSTDARLPYPFSEEVQKQQQPGASKQPGDQYANVPVDKVVTSALEYLRSTGLQHEGLFRVNAVVEDMDQVIRACAMGRRVDMLPDIDPYVAANVIKQYLRSRPDPIFPTEYYRDLLKTAKIQDNDEKITELRSLLEHMTIENKALLWTLCQFFTEVAEHEEDNNMSIETLAKTVAPLILRSDRRASLTHMISEVESVNATTIAIFKNYVQILG